MSVTPKKELGQHFLVDENILGVIGRLAELEPDDVVLEIGPGLGVLTRYLAERVAHVHAVEIDRSLEPSLARDPADDAPLRRRARGSTCRRSTRRRASSSRTSPTTSRPRSSSRASTACPIARLWCVMVQREVADRFFAAPGDEGLRRRLGADPARRRAHRLPPGLARGLPPAAERRLGARRLPPDRAGPAARRSSASSRRRSPTGGRRSRTRSRSPASATARARRRRRSTSIGRGAGARAEELAPAEFVALAAALR